MNDIIIQSIFSLKDDFSAGVIKMEENINRFSERLTQLESTTNKVFETISGQSQKLKGNLSQIEIPPIKSKPIPIDPMLKFERKILSSFANIGKGAMNLFSKVQSVAFGIYAIFKAFQKVFEISDRIINIDAKVRLITNTKEEAQRMKSQLFNISNGLGVNYLDFGEQTIKIKQLTGDTFKTNEEAIRFSELLNKAFRISGTTIKESHSAILQLTQAMASGRLQGDEFRSILENAPMLAQGIAKHLGIPFGELKRLAKEGQLTAQTIKNAVADMGEELDKKFSQLPLTWGQIGAKFSNQFVKSIERITIYLNQLANSPFVQAIINGLGYAMKIIFSVIEVVIQGMTITFNMLYKVLRPLKPLIEGIVIALGIYNGLLLLTKGYQLGVALATRAWAIAQSGLAIAMGLVNGQLSLMTLLINLTPIGWITLAIVTLIGVIAGLTAIVNKFFGTTFSFLGMLVGILTTTGAFITNVFIAIIHIIGGIINGFCNNVISIVEFVANAITHPIQSAKNLIVDLVTTGLGALKSLAKAGDAILGTNMASKVGGWIENIGSHKKYKNNMISLDKYKIEQTYLNKFGRIGYGDAFKWGANLGDGWTKNIKGYFSGTTDTDESILNALQKQNSNLEEIKKNTGKKGKKGEKDKDKKTDKIEEWKEDLKLLISLAHREAINNIAQPIITVNANTNIENTIKKDWVDVIDGITDKITKDLTVKTQNSLLGVINK